MKYVSSRGYAIDVRLDDYHESLDKLNNGICDRGNSFFACGEKIILHHDIDNNEPSSSYSNSSLSINSIKHYSSNASNAIK